MQLPHLTGKSVWLVSHSITFTPYVVHRYIAYVGSSIMRGFFTVLFLDEIAAKNYCAASTPYRWDSYTSVSKHTEHDLDDILHIV